MSTEGSPPHDLTYFVPLLEQLGEAAIEYVVIGGCAVGLYAHLLGESLESSELELYVSGTAFEELSAWAEGSGLAVEKPRRPKGSHPTSWRWQGVAVHALTASPGLPPLGAALRSCREFSLEDTALPVYVADPFDVLANELRRERGGDTDYAELVTRYLELEVREAFEAGPSPRERLGPAKRLIEVVGRPELPERLAVDLIGLADVPVLRRFLASRIELGLFQQLLDKATDDAERAHLRERAGVPQS